MTAKDLTRTRDELILSILSLYRAGYPNSVIATRMGLTRGEVSTFRTRVLAADLKCSGEPKRVVLREYSA